MYSEVQRLPRVLLWLVIAAELWISLIVSQTTDSLPPIIEGSPLWSDNINFVSPKEARSIKIASRDPELKWSSRCRLPGSITLLSTATNPSGFNQRVTQIFNRATIDCGADNITFYLSNDAQYVCPDEGDTIQVIISPQATLNRKLTWNSTEKQLSFRILKSPPLTSAVQPLWSSVYILSAVATVSAGFLGHPAMTVVVPRAQMLYRLSTCSFSTNFVVDGLQYWLRIPLGSSNYRFFAGAALVNLVTIGLVLVLHVIVLWKFRLFCHAIEESNRLLQRDPLLFWKDIPSDCRSYYREPLCLSSVSPQPADPSKEEINAAFEHFDSDSSGFIDHNELKGALKELGFDLSDAALNKVMSDLDTDGNGQLDRTEFADLVDSLQRPSEPPTVAAVLNESTFPSNYVFVLVLFSQIAAHSTIVVIWHGETVPSRVLAGFLIVPWLLLAVLLFYLVIGVFPMHWWPSEGVQPRSGCQRLWTMLMSKAGDWKTEEKPPPKPKEEEKVADDANGKEAGREKDPSSPSSSSSTSSSSSSESSERSDETDSTDSAETVKEKPETAQPDPSRSEEKPSDPALKIDSDAPTPAGTNSEPLEQRNDGPTLQHDEDPREAPATTKASSIQKLMGLSLSEKLRTVSALGGLSNPEVYRKRLGPIFLKFRGDREWFLLIEVIVSVVFGLLEAVRSSEGCVPIAGTSLGVSAIYFGAIILLRPYNFTVDFLYFLFGSFTLTASSALLLVFHLDRSQTWAEFFSGVLIVIWLLLSIPRFAALCWTYWREETESSDWRAWMSNHRPFDFGESRTSMFVALFGPDRSEKLPERQIEEENPQRKAIPEGTERRVWLRNYRRHVGDHFRRLQLEDSDSEATDGELPLLSLGVVA